MAFNFKSIPGRWTARKDTGLRSKSGFSYVMPKATVLLCQHGVAVQRAGIADGGEFYIRPPGTAAWLFDKVKY